MLFLTSCSDLVSILRLCCQKSSAIASEGRGKFRKIRDFGKFLDFLNFLSSFSYTRPPRGNQVDDLPRAPTYAIGTACVPRGLALIGDFACKNVYAVDNLRFILRCRIINRCYF